MPTLLVVDHKHQSVYTTNVSTRRAEALVRIHNETLDPNYPVYDVNLFFIGVDIRINKENDVPLEVMMHERKKELSIVYPSVHVNNINKTVDLYNDKETELTIDMFIR